MNRGRWVSIFSILLALTALWGAAKINTDYLKRVPHVQDSVNTWFQARLFAMGRTYIETPKNVKSFSSELLVIKDGRWYCHYPFLHPFITMLGMQAGVVWLVNPLLAAITVILVYTIGTECYNRRVGLWAAIFLVSSPFFMVMSASYMSHPLGLFLTASSLLFFIRQMKAPSVKNAVFAGSSLGLLFNTRPLTAFALALPLIGFHLRNRDGFKKSSLRHLSIFLMVLFIWVGMFFLYSSNLSGKTLQFATQTKVSETVGPTSIKLLNRFFNSFSALGVARSGHTAAKGLGTTRALLELLHTYALNWPSWFNFSFFLIPLIPIKRKEYDHFFYVTFISIPFLYAFYWRSAIMYGPRYIYEVMPMVVLLSARGMDVCLESAEWVHNHTFLRNWKSFSSARMTTAFCLYIFTGILIATNINQFYFRKDYDLKTKPIVSLVPMTVSAMKNFNGIKRTIPDTVEELGITNAIVFVQDKRWQGFGSVASFNHPLLNTDVVYARDLGDDSLKAVMDMFPNKSAYWTQYPKVKVHALFYDKHNDSLRKIPL
ncbi:MAG: glycosyltransferase family 39 protein [bacterium]